MLNSGGILIVLGILSVKEINIQAVHQVQRCKHVPTYYTHMFISE